MEPRFTLKGKFSGRKFLKRLHSLLIGGRGGTVCVTVDDPVVRHPGSIRILPVTSPSPSSLGAQCYSSLFSSSCVSSSFFPFSKRLPWQLDASSSGNKTSIDSAFERRMIAAKRPERVEEGNRKGSQIRNLRRETGFRDRGVSRNSSKELRNRESEESLRYPIPPYM